MSSIETKKKKKGVSILSSSRTGQFKLHLENLNLTERYSEELDPKEWIKKSFLERQIEDIVWKWRIANRKFKKDYKELFSPTKVRNHIQTLEKAHTLLVRLEDWLRDDKRVATIHVVNKSTNETLILKATDYLAMGGLKWVSAWLAEIDLKKGGRTPEAMIANCAEELAELFKDQTGLSRWKKVGEIVARAFPEILSADDGGRDVRLWIKNLVKRNQSRRKRILEQKMKLQ